MDFTTRNGQIIQIMLERGEPVQSQEIADILGISVRTVQRELPYLKDAVKKYGMILTRNRATGNYLSGTPTARERLMSALPGNNSIDPTDKTERQHYLLFELLKEREPRKLFYYSNILGVSETTIAADIESLGPWLSKNRLKVVKKRGYGVFLKGSEQDYREAMRRFIEENISQGVAQSAKFNDVSFSEALMNSANSQMYAFLDTNILHRVHKVLMAMEEPRLISLAENAYAGLVTHIAIAIVRIKKGGFLQVSKDMLSGFENWEDYDLATRILEEMEEEFEIAIPKEEVLYVLLHIQGSKLAYSSDVAYQDNPELGEDELLEIIDQMIDIYNPKLAPQIKSDEEFVRGLMVHLRPVFIRLKENMNIYNPMLADIRAEYPDIFRRCKIASSVIKNAVGRAVTDEEVGFLAMHFGAVEERLGEREYERRVSIGIVCASGFGVARLMMTRLEKFLSDKAYLKAYGRDELTGSRVREMDFFVSTMNLDDYGIDYLRVSPLITGSDLSLIEHKMKDYSHMRRRSGQEDFIRLLHRAEVISKDMQDLLAGCKAYKVSPMVSFKELLLFLGLKVAGNTVSASKIAKAIEEREKLYTQLFLDLSIGLLHCRSEAVDKVVFVSATPKDAEKFLDPYFTSIRAVVMMISPDDECREEHAQVLGIISTAFVNNPIFLDAIKRGEEEEIYAELMAELRKQYLKILGK